MAGQANFAQTSFIGGEWSKQFQGRFDRDDYRTGMNVCLNVIPLEEGAAPRRPGTKLGGPTRSGAYAVIREFFFSGASPFNVELTAGHLRLWAVNGSVVTYTAAFRIASVSGANPAVVTTSVGHGYSTGDQVIFTAQGVTDYSGVAPMLNRQIAITVTGSTTFTIADALTGTTIDGSTITLADAALMNVNKIFDVTTSYLQSELQQVRLVQDGAACLLLHAKHPPLQLTVTQDGNGNLITAAVTNPTLIDGPYLDPPVDGSTLTPTGTSGTITLTASSISSINGGAGFLSTDVGRLIRLYSQPTAWSSSTTYNNQDIVLFGGIAYQSIAANNHNFQPDTDGGVHWSIDPSGQAWTWGTIATVTGAATCTLTLATPTPQNDPQVAGGSLLYSNAITVWRLGAWGTTTGWPSVGTYQQGRVWFGGPKPNRFDACVSNDFGSNGYINFAPTLLDGTVTDNNGISETLNAEEIENLWWMLPDEQGVLVGTESGEWIIASSSAGEPITPTSIQARETTRYGSINQSAIKVGRATIFISRDTRKVYEYMANYFTQKFVADNLTLRSKHLTFSGVAELAFMRELTPIIWARLNNGTLIGCTYKHDDPIKPIELWGWHRHQLGTGRNIISIQGGPANGGETDTLSLVTQDPATGYCYVEFLQTLWDAGDSLLTAWFVDGGQTPAGAKQITIGGQLYIRVYGLWYMVGQTVDVWAAGLDMGSFTVTSGGTIDIPVGAAGSLFTTAWLAQITANGCLTGYVDVP